MPHIDVIDLYHLDKEPDFGTLKAQGVRGVILKASQGSNSTDPKFVDWLARAQSVFGKDMVHAYHMLTGDDAAAQMRLFLTATVNCPHRWLDYEDPCPSLQTAIDACHILANKQGKFPGMYGSDGAQLGQALLGGHFTVCPLWIARYGPQAPLHKCDLWQFAEADADHVYDSSVYLGRKSLTLERWMATV